MCLHDVRDIVLGFGKSPLYLQNAKSSVQVTCSPYVVPIAQWVECPPDNWLIPFSIYFNIFFSFIGNNIIIRYYWVI